MTPKQIGTAMRQPMTTQNLPVAAFRFPTKLAHTIPADYRDTDPEALRQYVGPRHYPVVQDPHPTGHISVDTYTHATVYVLQQDGHWVHGLDVTTRAGGGGFHPSRKWGEFPDEYTATLYAWESVEHRLRTYIDTTPGPHTKCKMLLSQAQHQLAHLFRQGETFSAPHMHTFPPLSSPAQPRQLSLF